MAEDAAAITPANAGAALVGACVVGCGLTGDVALTVGVDVTGELVRVGFVGTAGADDVGALESVGAETFVSTGEPDTTGAALSTGAADGANVLLAPNSATCQAARTPLLSAT